MNSERDRAADASEPKLHDRPAFGRALLESVLAGMVCAAMSMIVGITVRVLQMQTTRMPTDIEGRISPPVVTRSVSGAPPVPSGASDPGFAVAVVIGPVLETLIFLALFFACDARKSSTRAWAYVAVMASLGWFLHGASLADVNRILPFALLAALFLRWDRIAPLWFAFGVTALAHIVWNFIAFSIYYFRQS